MNLDEGLTTLDPAFASSRNPLWMTEQVFNGLVELDSALRLQASLAQSWDLSADGKTYTFHLRGDVFFHRDPCFGAAETRKMKASDFVYSLTRICQPVLASPGLWVFNGKVRGVGEFREGKALTISGFRAPDDSTFVIELNEAFPPFLSLLAMPYGYVLPYEAVDYYGDRFREHPVGTGPFYIYRWNEGQRLILHKNPVYFEWEQGQRLPGVDAVSVSFIPSRLSAFIEFVQGKLDFVGDLDNSYRDELLYPDGTLKEAYAEKYQFLLAPQLNTEYLAFQVDQSLDHVKNHPLSDIRLRKAINYAIDRKKLVKYLLNGMGYPAESGFIPFGMPGFDSLAVRGYTFDPEAARRLLAEAGYPGGKGLPPLVLNSTQKYEHISEFIQKSLENVGIRVQVQNM
ncbi:MAG: ABC transporter substrate-binding protein, partial [Bacteroidetes bacterium]